MKVRCYKRDISELGLGIQYLFPFVLFLDRDISCRQKTMEGAKQMVKFNFGRVDSWQKRILRWHGVSISTRKFCNMVLSLIVKIGHFVARHFTISMCFEDFNTLHSIKLLGIWTTHDIKRSDACIFKFMVEQNFIRIKIYVISK